MDVISALELSYDQNSRLIAGVDRAQLHDVSPCADWDLRTILNQLVAMLMMFTLVNQGHENGP